MDLRVLGPVEVRRAGDSAPQAVPYPKTRQAIALLAATPTRTMTSGQLAERLWDVPPRSAESGVTTLMSRAREALDGRLRSIRGRGYELALEAGDQVDLDTFRDLLRLGQDLAGDGRPDRAEGRLTDAVRMWRPPILHDFPVTVRTAALYRSLFEEFHAARDALVDVRFLLGDHLRLVSELRLAVTDEPLEEHLWARLMLALYRSGRASAAVTAYDDAVALLGREALTAGEELVRMRALVLARDPILEEPRPWLPREAALPHATRPLARQLPPDVNGWTGRTPEIARLVRRLTASPGHGPPVVQIVGMPGVGKTALAVHVAHQVARHFPDGQLYFPMAGAGATPRDPAFALYEALVHVFGVAAQHVPERLEDRAAMYRSCLAGRRMLVVIDDAAGPGQIPPLLPGGPGCGVVITSRVQSSGVAGGEILSLDPLSHDEAMAMLTRLAGPRVGADPGGARDIITACSGLPLALLIAGSRLATRPSWQPGRLARQLADGVSRLDVLTYGDRAVRSALAGSYAMLSATAQRVFRRLAWAGAGNLAPWAVGVLLGGAPPGPVMDELVDRHLLMQDGVDALGQPRYRQHDLVRDYATELCSADPDADAALSALLAGWLDVLDVADRALPPSPFFAPPVRRVPRELPPGTEPAGDSPSAWIGSELRSLLALTDTACAAGQYPLAAAIAVRLAAYQHLQGLRNEAERMWRTIVTAAEDAGDVPAAADARLRLAMVLGPDLGRFDAAVGLLDECVRVHRNTPQDDGRLAVALSCRAFCARAAGGGGAERDARAGLDLARASGDGHTMFMCLSTLGSLAQADGRDAEAVALCDQALRITAELGVSTWHGVALWMLVSVLLAIGNPERALTLSDEGIGLCEDTGHILGLSRHLAQRGEALAGLDRLDEAIESFTAAFMHIGRHDEWFAARTRVSLAGVLRRAGRLPEAREQYRDAIAVFGRRGMAVEENEARDALAGCGH